MPPLGAQNATDTQRNDERTCPTCGKQFTPTRSNQRFCPPTDRDRQSNGQARSRCRHRWHNAKCRGDDLTAPLPAPFHCAQCGKHCIPGEDGTSPQATRFCGKDCNARWQKHNRELPLLRLAKANERVALATAEREIRITTWPPISTAGDLPAWKAVLAADPCAYCGGPATGLDHIQPTARGGEDTAENQTGCCKHCNAIKSATTLLLFLGWERARREFAPWRRAVGALYRK